MTENTRNRGRSIIERLWEELDSIVDQLMTGEQPSNTEPPSENASEQMWDEFLNQEHEEWQAYGEMRGQAQGVAYAIAVMTNPYAPDVPAIREQAMQRWEARQE